VASGEDVSDVTSPSSAAARALLSREGEDARVVATPTSSFVSISRRARASAQGLRLHDFRCAWLRIRSRSRPRTLGPGDLAVDRVPTRSCQSLFARRHSFEDAGELGRLPFRGAQHVGWDFRSAWVRAGGDPGPIDRCLLLTDVVFKDDRPKSRRTSHRRSHAMREPSLHGEAAHFGEPPDRAGALSPPAAVPSAYL